MHLKSLGHAAVLLTAGSGQRLMVDPYESGGLGGAVRYGPITERADAVVCSHEHADHSATDAVPGSPEILEEGSWGPFVVRRHRAWHDEYEGRRRGGAVDLLEIECEGLRIVHASDVGQAPEPELAEALYGPDVLFLPVGGFYTIGAAQAWEWWRRLGSPALIPLHYKTEGIELPVRGVEVFEAYVAPRARRRLDAAVCRAHVLCAGQVSVLPMAHAPGEPV